MMSLTKLHQAFSLQSRREQTACRLSKAPWFPFYFRCISAVIWLEFSRARRSAVERSFRRPGSGQRLTRAAARSVRIDPVRRRRRPAAVTSSAASTWRRHTAVRRGPVRPARLWGPSGPHRPLGSALTFTRVAGVQWKVPYWDFYTSSRRHCLGRWRCLTSRH